MPNITTTPNNETNRRQRKPVLPGETYAEWRDREVSDADQEAADKKYDEAGGQGRW